MTLKLPKVIGHRGAKGYAPENTCASIQSAADMGVAWIEIDVKLTKDNVPIIFHDDSLDRTTNGAGLVAETNWADIKELDAGHWFADSFMDTRVPTLEDAIDVILKNDLGLNLEIKPCTGRETETSEIVLDQLSQIWDAHDKILLSSFQMTSLEVARDMAPEWARGLLLEEEIPSNWADLVDLIEPSTLNINADTKKDAVEELVQAQLPILAYTVNDPYHAQKLESWGVEGFFSDVPDILIDNL